MGASSLIDEELFLRISVKDTGIGIKVEDQSKLFKLFGFIADASDKNINGIGLGLVISEKIVKQFDGTITMQSVYEEGSEFTFTLKINCE